MLFYISKSLSIQYFWTLTRSKTKFYHLLIDYTQQMLYDLTKKINTIWKSTANEDIKVNCLGPSEISNLRDDQHFQKMKKKDSFPLILKV